MNALNVIPKSSCVLESTIRENKDAEKSIWDKIQIREGKEKTDKKGQPVRGNRKIYKQWCVLGDRFLTSQKTVVPSSFESSILGLLALKTRAPQYFKRLAATSIGAASHSRRPELPEQRRSAMVATSVKDDKMTMITSVFFQY